MKNLEEPARIVVEDRRFNRKDVEDLIFQIYSLASIVNDDCAVNKGITQRAIKTAKKYEI